MVFSSCYMAGAGGFEPPVTGPKPVALPLGHAPAVTSRNLLRTFKRSGCRTIQSGFQNSCLHIFRIFICIELQSLAEFLQFLLHISIPAVFPLRRINAEKLISSIVCVPNREVKLIHNYLPIGCASSPVRGFHTRCSKYTGNQVSGFSVLQICRKMQPLYSVQAWSRA